jgi:hypothetical protein
MFAMKVMLTAALGLFLAGSAQAAPQPCTDAGYHQFDFWLGAWDVFETSGGPREARASITSVQNGCGVREVFRNDDGSGGGESLNTFDPHTGLWRQSWLSDKGQIAVMEGRKQSKSITLRGPETGDAVGRIIRGTWSPAAGGTLHETAERSDDGGKTWKPWYDLTLKPHRS